MRSDVFEKSTKFHTDNVFAWSLYGLFPGVLGQFTPVTYPRWTSSLGPRDPKRIGLGTKGPTIWLGARYIFPCKNFFSPVRYFFLKSPIPSPPPPLQSEMVVPKQMTFHYPVLIGHDGWEIFLIGRDAWEICINQSEPLPRSGYRHVVSRGFPPLFLGLQVISGAGGDQWSLYEMSSVFLSLDSLDFHANGSENVP